MIEAEWNKADIYATKCIYVLYNDRSGYLSFRITVNILFVTYRRSLKISYISKDFEVVKLNVFK